MLRLLSFFILLSSLNAELVWEKTKLEHKATLSEKLVDFTFKFKNNSSTSVTISKLLSSCGCTTVELEKKNFSAHSSGSITAQMNLKGIKGLKSSTIKVYLNDDKSPTHTLTVKVDVPSPIQIAPTFINWRKSDERKSKAVTIKIHSEFKAKLTKLDHKNQAFKTSLKANEDGSQTLSITPPSRELLKNGREKSPSTSRLQRQNH